MTLSELKAQAQALGLTKDFISQHGDLRKKSTWQAAVNACEFSESEPEDEAEETVSDNLFEPLEQPEIINITPESHPEIWQHLEPPTEPEPVETTYQVITEDPPITSHIFTPKPFIHCNKPEESLHKRTLPKLPLQDFFAALFSPPNHYQTSQ